MIEFEINKIIYYAPKKGYYVQLKGLSDNQVISILIDREEVQAIALYIEGIQAPRPMTHDLFTDIIFNFDIKIKRIEFYDFLDDSIYVNLCLFSNQHKIKKIDCRPCDAIALALREDCSIYVSRKILDKMDKTTDAIFDATEEFNHKGIDRKDIIIRKLKFSMENAIKKENYEFAAKIRDKIESLDK